MNCILYLLNNTEEDIKTFRKSISSLSSSYLNRYPCDVICLHEKDFPESEKRHLLSSYNLIFHEVAFTTPHIDGYESIPNKLPHCEKIHRDSGKYFSIGYRHMCRMYSGDLFKMSFLKKYRYLWRLDTDSYILNEINYNVFDKLHENNAVYGYINIQKDHPNATLDFYESLQKVIKNDLGEDYIFPDEEKNKVYYTNFEVLDLNFFRSARYLSIYESIDKTLGFYNRRWGDHIFRYSVLNFLLDKSNFFFYHDIDYYHGRRFLNNELLQTYTGEGIDFEYAKLLRESYPIR
jgi:hypothetical protein